MHDGARRARAAVTCVILALALPAAARAQADTTARAEMDSLRARVERAEEALELLRQQLAAQATAGVQSRSRLQLELTGRVLVNGFGNSRRVNNADNPQFVRPDTAAGAPVSGGGGAIRQTTLGLAVAAPNVLGGTFRGDLDLDFYGGQQPSSGGRTFPLLRLRTARGFLVWSRGELMIGQESPLIAGVSPASLAAVGTPAFAAAGNLWLWLPQVRLTGELIGSASSRARLGLQGAVLAPTSGDPAGAFDTDVDAAERSGRPFLQTRLRLRWGPDEAPGEIGAGYHVGWVMRSALRTRGDVAAVDVRLPVGPLELRGEAYDGELARGLGGGGIGQNFGLQPADPRSPQPVVADRGAWAQLNARLAGGHVLGGGCGVDDPSNPDAQLLRRRNLACQGHVMLRPAGPMVVGLEFRRLSTRYASGDLASSHVNVAVGFEF